MCASSVGLLTLKSTYTDASSMFASNVIFWILVVSSVCAKLGFLCVGEQGCF